MRNYNKLVLERDFIWEKYVRLSKPTYPHNPSAADIEQFYKRRDDWFETREQLFQAYAKARDAVEKVEQSFELHDA